MDPESHPTGILFVCLGNICRSPMAEAIMRHKLAQRRLTARYSVDSAGTGDWHVGELPDQRTLAVLAQRGVAPPSKARQIRTADFANFDHIVAMDQANLRDVLRWPGSIPEKVSLMLDWDPATVGLEVPDPYYGGPEHFAVLFSMLDKAIESLLASLCRHGGQGE